MATAPLNERIREALKGGKSAGMAELISEANAAATQAQEACDAARERALDPLLSSEEVTQARKDREDAGFDRDRMVQAAKMLGEALIEFERGERQDRLQEAYDLARAQLEAIGKQVRERYPVIANELGAMFRDMVAADAAIRTANQNKPDGAESLLSIDVLLRGPGNGFSIAPSRQTLPEAINLPSLGYGLIWGRPLVGPDGPKLFTPEPTNAEPSASGSAATGDAATPGNRPASPVRLVVHDTGEAA